jgi:endoglycosylceramidase
MIASSFAWPVAARGAMATGVPSVAPSLPWLQVGHPAGRRAQMVDQAGRTVMLRGVNLVGVEDDFYRTASGQEPGPAPMWSIDPAAYQGSCPAMSHDAGEPPVCEVQAGRPTFEQSAAPDSHNDLAQMRALGINFIRLGLSWSQLEPVPGSYNTLYLDRIEQVVGWARQQGIYVLLDMHQDNYSRYTPETAPASLPPLLVPTKESSAHADGAPPWAVMTDGAPALGLLGQGELNLFVEAAFNSFWLNRIPTDGAGLPLPQGQAPGLGLQDHYIGAMAAVARRFHGDSTVVGYEIMNEPLPGLVPPVAFSSADLYPFYRRVIDALTGAADGLPCPASGVANPVCGYPDLGVHVDRQAFFFEPMAVRNLTDGPDQAALPFSSYPGLVYSPHVYTHTFTVDRMLGLPPSQSPYPVSYDQAYQVADAEAKVMGAALVIGEYGNSARDDEVVLRGTTTAQDVAMVGSTIYSWKGACSTGTAQATCDGDAWSWYASDPAAAPAQNLALLPTRVKFLARVVPRATAGRLDSFAYHPDDRSFTMAATADHQVTTGSWSDETMVFLPATVAGSVTVSGAATLDRVVTNPDGTRMAYVAPTAAGPYSVAVPS